MGRTPLASRMQDIALSRRQVLGAAGASALSLAAWTPRAPAATSDRIVIVGAGLAGLTCAYRLMQAGVAAELHEASDRLGGRCWSIRGAFGPGLVAEHGGELIDTGHVEMRQLSKELGFRLDNLIQGETNGTEPLYYFDGKPYTFEEASEDFNGVYQKLHKDVSAASYPTTYSTSTPRGRELDAMTVTEWIEESALNLLYLLGYSGQGKLRLFGPSNEKFHVRGGNDQIPQAMAAALRGQITMGSELAGIRLTSGGRYTLTFDQRTTTKTITADRVVLALPFSILRRSVDFSQAGFDTRKTRAIRE